MNITFDKALKQRVWQTVNRKVVNNTCPFCRVVITGRNFAGAAFIDEEFRAFDGNLTCLIQLSDHIKGDLDG